MEKMVMFLDILSHRSTPPRLAFSCGLAILILLTPLVRSSGFWIASASELPSPTSFSLTSLLGLDDLAKKTLNQIDQSIGLTQGALHDELDHLHNEVADIISQLESTYKDLLNVSISSLDTETQRLAAQLVNELDDINNKINADIDHAQDALLTAV